MIVKKILIDNAFVPDIPENIAYTSCTLNPDGETYTLTGVSFTNGMPLKISTLQGKLLLAQMGKIDQIEAMIQQSGRPEQIYWEYATEWERTSPILNRLAPVVGLSQADLDQFFINASKLI